MARYMSTQYPSKNSGHQHKSKKGDRNGKKGGDPKSGDKDNNAKCIVGVHVRDVTTPKDSSGRSSIDAHVLEATEQPSWPTYSIEDLLGTHFIDDASWGGTNPCDVSVDTRNSKKVMAGSHITEYTHSNFVDLFNMSS